MADARITGRACVGGIVGTSNGGPITNCHVLSDVAILFVGSEQAHGGIAGLTSGNISGCTSAASITGHFNVGGILGLNKGIVSNCLYLGNTISGYKSVGAIVGENLAGGTIQNCYYTDTNIRGRNDSGSQLKNNVSAVGNNAGTVTNSGLAYSIALDTDVSIAGDQTVYNVSGLTAYGTTVLSYNNGTTTTYYSGEGATVALGHSEAKWYSFGGYSINGTPIEGDSFTMPAGNISITVNWEPDFELQSTLFKAGTQNTWMTWCDYVTRKLPEGCKAYTVNGADVENGKVAVMELSGDVIPAFVPVLINREAGELAADIKAEFNSVADENVSNSGTGYDEIDKTTRANEGTVIASYEGGCVYANAGTVENPDNTGWVVNDEYTATYVLYDDAFLRVDSDNGIREHRWILRVSIAKNVCSRSLSIGGEGTTAISGVDSGQFTVDSWYSLDGRKLEGVPTKKGLYIHNGKKEVVK